jgi:hypothetical protein
MSSKAGARYWCIHNGGRCKLKPYHILAIDNRVAVFVCTRHYKRFASLPGYKQAVIIWITNLSRLQGLVL